VIEPMPRIEAVGFDFDHTLGLDHGLEAQAFVALAAELGTTISFSEEPWRTTITHLLARFRGGEMSTEAAVAAFCAALGRDADPAYATRWREICLELVPAHVTPVDGARDLVAALRERGVPIAILTNGWSPLQEHKIARALGDFPEPILVSERLGVAKPDPAAFAQLVAALGVAAGAVAYVGDNPSTDVRGAQDAGLVDIWFDWEGVSYPAAAPPARYVVSRLVDVNALVPGREAETENSSSVTGWGR